MRRPALVLLGAVLSLAGCAGAARAPGLAKWAESGDKYMVAADHPLASKAGAGMLAHGGNVVDAAVATSFALSVTRPYSMGIGGGGFMIIHRVGKEPVVLDYREAAPLAASADKYLDEQGNIIEGKTVRGHWAVGVPGQVKGLAYALENYGTKSLHEVLQPAIQLAWEGIRVDEHTHEAMSKLAAYIKEHPEEKALYQEIARIYLKDGEPYRVGERLKQEELAKTLRLLADGGADAFYKGVISRRILDDMRTQLGPMTALDLGTYEVKVRKPLRGTFRGYDVIGMPPPSSGGACLLQVLNVIGGYDPKTTPEADYYHVLAESMKHAFADRAAYLGDADFHPEVSADVARMISSEHAAKVRAAIRPDRVSDATEYGRRWLGDDGGTSHYSVIDKDGNAVAATETINLYFGSYVVPHGTGIILNNELDDFAVKTGVPNEFGLLMSERNVIHSRQRPLSSMSPTMLLKDGRAVIAAGASGGPRIITATLQTLLRIVDFSERPDAAVAAPRIHHQWSPDVLRYEPGLSAAVRSVLSGRGHQMKEYDGSGVCQVVQRDGKRLIGASDPRKGGRPAGR
ncbi:MAG: gamma-glutamyltransferase [Elusimicrobiota bacterium]